MLKHTIIITMIYFCGSVCCADTFRNRLTGEVFHGFATQKKKQNLTMVYIGDEKKFKSLNLGEFDITHDARGRRNNVVVIPLKSEEIIISQVVVETVSEEIISASNKGPRFIMIEIDSPGGRGDYMRQLCSVITKTDNCPVVAYVKGGKFSGAYSAAAAVALACDKVYIAPDTVMGTVGPAVGNLRDDYNSGHTEMFSSKNLSAYKSYIAALAEKNNRPVVVAMAMLDRTIEVIEVVDKDGKKTLIDKSERQSSQSVVRTWSKQFVKPGAGLYGSADQTNQMTLTLTPTDAIYTRMADKIVSSRAEVLQDMGASDAKLISKGSLTDKIIRKFVAARRNLSRILASVDFLQERADELEKQLNEQNREVTVTSFQNNRTSSRFDNRLSDRIDRQRGLYQTVPRMRGRRIRERLESEVVVESETGLNRNDLLDEISFVLIDLIRDYNKAIVLARRYPGALPLGMNVTMLEKRFDTAEVLYNSVISRR